VITKSLNDFIQVYKKELQKGDILVAYNELINFVTKLKISISKKHSNKFSFGGIFKGYMDYTYFYFSNDYLKSKKLKLGIVLNHKKMRFEIWLLGNTKVIQKEYWVLLKSTKWITTKEIPKYSIFATVIIEKPDFNNLNLLSDEIENKSIQVSDSIIHTLKYIDKDT
jgi:hypothetical protein